ncbi:MAG: hypothetical protein IJU39_02775 [Clostridia bacterium]|nr:hypothetical protein [Clostridia bacterium]
MKKSFKRILSTLLVLSIMLSLFAVHASAATVSESESNNDYASANKITLGNTIKGTISSTSDVDYFKIQTSTNGKVDITFKHTYENNGSKGWVICMYEYKDGKYTQITDYSIKYNSGEIISLPALGVSASVVYYVAVKGISSYYPVGKEYQLVTSFTSTDCYEKEVNNEYAKATAISLGNTYGGNINKYDDLDFYKIVSSKDGKVNINFEHTFEDNGSKGWVVNVFEYKDGKYTEITDYTIKYNSGEKIALPALGVVASVTYFVVVKGISSYYPVGKEYQLVTSFTSTDYYEKEINNEFAKATPVSLGHTYGGNINKYDDLDFYKIVADKNGEIKVYFSHVYENSSLRWRIRTYVYKDGNYTELSETTVYINKDEEVTLPAIGAEASGVYYVRVESIYGYRPVGREYTISFGGTGGGSGNNPTPVEPTDSGFFANLANLINEWANSDNILLRILGIILKVILPFVG